MVRREDCLVREDLKFESRTDVGESLSLPESLGGREEIGGRARVRDERSGSDIWAIFEPK